MVCGRDKVVADFDSAVAKMQPGGPSPTLCVIGCGSQKLAKDFASVLCPVGDDPRHRLFTDPTKQLQRRCESLFPSQRMRRYPELNRGIRSKIIIRIASGQALSAYQSIQRFVQVRSCAWPDWPHQVLRRAARDGRRLVARSQTAFAVALTPASFLPRRASRALSSPPRPRRPVRERGNERSGLPLFLELRIR